MLTRQLALADPPFTLMDLLRAGPSSALKVEIASPAWGDQARVDTYRRGEPGLGARCCAAPPTCEIKRLVMRQTALSGTPSRGGRIATTSIRAADSAGCV